MRLLASRSLAACLLLLAPAVVDAQASHGYQTDFSREELAARRARVLDAIGPQGMAIVQGASEDFSRPLRPSWRILLR